MILKPSNNFPEIFFSVFENKIVTSCTIGAIFFSLRGIGLVLFVNKGSLCENFPFVSLCRHDVGQLDTYLLQRRLLEGSGNPVIMLSCPTLPKQVLAWTKGS